MEKKEQSDIEIVIVTTKSSGLETNLTIVFQELSTAKVFLIKHPVDSILLQILDERRQKDTTNELIEYIIKRSFHTSVELKDIDSIKEHVWAHDKLDRLKSKIRDIKINQIII